MQEALLRAQYGDYSGMQALGLMQDQGTAGRPIYNPSDDSPDSPKDDGAEEGGYNNNQFYAAMSSLKTMLAQGKIENAVKGIDSFWYKLSKGQQNEVQKALSEYGYSYEG